MKANVDRKLLEHFARGWNAAQKTGALSATDFKALHGQFHAEDQTGTIWTVGVNTLKWHRAQNGKWEAGQPPDALTMESDVLAMLTRIMPPPAGSTPQRPSPTAQPGQLRLRLASGATVALARGKTLTAAELGLTGGSSPFAEVNASVKDPTANALKNLSGKAWSVTTAKGEKGNVDPGRSMRLAIGSTIDFGGMRAEIVG
jgi:hypothetical protein